MHPALLVFFLGIGAVSMLLFWGAVEEKLAFPNAQKVGKSYLL